MVKAVVEAEVAMVVTVETEAVGAAVVVAVRPVAQEDKMEVVAVAKEVVVAVMAAMVVKAAEALPAGARAANLAAVNLEVEMEAALAPAALQAAGVATSRRADKTRSSNPGALGRLGSLRHPWDDAQQVAALHVQQRVACGRAQQECIRSARGGCSMTWPPRRAVAPRPYAPSSRGCVECCASESLVTLKQTRFIFYLS